jgi:putative membrane protein insertion efficiency factor
MKFILLALIRIYQKTSFIHEGILKYIFGSESGCRFTPTCSRYTYEAIKKYGALKGSYMGIKRIVRCNPWSKGGYDPVK